MNEDLGRIVYTSGEIDKKVSETAEKINNDFKGEEVVFICVLNGAIMFFSDLMKKINLKCRFDTIKVSSYGNGTKSSGNVKIEKDISENIEGCNVVIVEDIIDSGRTLLELKKLFGKRNPRVVKICTIFNKPSGRRADIEPDYPSLIIGDEFVVGYGLDYAGNYRNLPHLSALL